MAVVRNVNVPGVWLIAIGAGCNLAAIVANGGWMPADPTALDSIGGLGNGYTNSIVVAEPAVRPITDIFALPAWLPLANVFSLGDVLIGIGIAATIASHEDSSVIHHAGRLNADLSLGCNGHGARTADDRAVAGRRIGDDAEQQSPEPPTGAWSA